MCHAYRFLVSIHRSYLIQCLCYFNANFQTMQLHKVWCLCGSFFTKCDFWVTANKWYFYEESTANDLLLFFFLHLFVGKSKLIFELCADDSQSPFVVSIFWSRGHYWSFVIQPVVIQSEYLALSFRFFCIDLKQMKQPISGNCVLHIIIIKRICYPHCMSNTPNLCIAQAAVQRYNKEKLELIKKRRSQKQHKNIAQKTYHRLSRTIEINVCT